MAEFVGYGRGLVHPLVPVGIGLEHVHLNVDEK